MANTSPKLALFLHGLYGGGAERTMLHLAQGIAERGYAVDLVLARTVGPYLNEVPSRVRVVDLNASRVLFSLPSLIRYIRHEKPDVMVSVLDYTNIIALWARRLAGNFPRLFVVEQNTFSQQNQQLDFPRRWLMAKFLKAFYPWAEKVVVVSQGVADDLVNKIGVKPEVIQVIYNPVITPETYRKIKEPIDHPWFQNGSCPVLLAAGRLTAQKDFPTLIRAFAWVRERQPARLLILGEGEDRPQLEALVKELGLEQDVSLPGFVPNPYPYMAHAALYVLSSRWEGLPTVLVEALFCGLPVVATDCPSGPREILRNGQLGKLVPVGDPLALAQAIEAALKGNVLHPPEESWKPYELDHIVDQYLHLLYGA